MNCGENKSGGEVIKEKKFLDCYRIVFVYCINWFLLE